MSLARLRWLSIVVPVALLVAFAILLRSPFHDFLHEFPGILVLVCILAVGVTVFSFAIFGAIGRVERRVFQRNDELAALLAVGQEAASAVELTEMLDKALDAILAVTPAEMAEIWLTTDDGALALERQRGIGVDGRARGTAWRRAKGCPASRSSRASAVLVHDPASDPRFVSREIAELGLRDVLRTAAPAPRRDRRRARASRPATGRRSRTRRSSGCSKGSASRSPWRSRTPGS